MGKLNEMEKLKNLIHGVRYHPLLLDEIKGLVLGTGHEKEFLNSLQSQLTFVKTLGYSAVCMKQIEKLKNSSDLYSMHLESKNFNYRILFSFMENGETLLHLFYERQGKRHTDYSRHTPIAQIRLQELKEELE